MDDLISYPINFRNRPEVIATIRVPRDMTHEEAEKICRIVMALALPIRDDKG